MTVKETAEHNEASVIIYKSGGFQIDKSIATEANGYACLPRASCAYLFKDEPGHYTLHQFTKTGYRSLSKLLHYFFMIHERDTDTYYDDEYDSVAGREGVPMQVDQRAPVFTDAMPSGLAPSVEGGENGAAIPFGAYDGLAGALAQLTQFVTPQPAQAASVIAQVERVQQLPVEFKAAAPEHPKDVEAAKKRTLKLKRSADAKEAKAKLDKEASDAKEAKAKLDKEASDAKEARAKLDKEAKAAKEAKAKLDKEAQDAKEAKAKLDKEAKDAKEAKAKLDKEQQDKEAKDAKEAKAKLDKEAKEAKAKLDKEAKDAKEAKAKLDKEQKDKEAKAKLDKEAQEQKDKETKAKLEKEAKDAKAKLDKDAKEAKAKLDKEAKEKEAKEAKEAKEKKKEVEAQEAKAKKKEAEVKKSKSSDEDESESESEKKSKTAKKGKKRKASEKKGAKTKKAKTAKKESKKTKAKSKKSDSSDDDDDSDKESSDDDEQDTDFEPDEEEHDDVGKKAKNKSKNKKSSEAEKKKRDKAVAKAEAKAKAVKDKKAKEAASKKSKDDKTDTDATMTSSEQDTAKTVESTAAEVVPMASTTDVFDLEAACDDAFTKPVASEESTNKGKDNAEADTTQMLPEASSTRECDWCHGDLDDAKELIDPDLYRCNTCYDHYTICDVCLDKVPMGGDNGQVYYNKASNCRFCVCKKSACLKKRMCQEPKCKGPTYCEEGKPDIRFCVNKSCGKHSPDFVEKPKAL